MFLCLQVKDGCTPGLLTVAERATGSCTGIFPVGNGGTVKLSRLSELLGGVWEIPVFFQLTLSHVKFSIAQKVWESWESHVELGTQQEPVGILVG